MERTIMDIPEEIRGKIFNYLQDTDIPNVRRVCLKWKQEIETWFKYQINLSYEEKSRKKFQEVLDYRIIKCTITQWKEPFSTLGPALPRPTIFKYSHLIRSMSFSTDSISGSNFHQIMQECAEYLSKLKLTLKSENEQSYENGITTPEEFSDSKGFFPWTHECNYDLAKLKRLSISDFRIHKDNSTVYRFRLNKDLFFNILNNVNTSGAKLTSFKVSLQFSNLSDAPYEIECDVALKYSEIILSVIANSSNSLKCLAIRSELDLEEFNNYHDSNDRSIPQFNFDTLKVTVDSTKMQDLVNLKKLALNFNEEYPLSNKQMWKSIFKQQKNLESFQIDGNYRIEDFENQFLTNKLQPKV